MKQRKQRLQMINFWKCFLMHGGQAQDVLFPVAAVVSFFARETQEGMGFPFEEDYELASPSADTDSSDAAATDGATKKKATVLQIIK